MVDILEDLGFKRRKSGRKSASLVRSVPDEEKSKEYGRFIPARYGESDGSGGCAYEIRKMDAEEYAAQCEFLEEELPPFLEQETGEAYRVVTNHPISIPVDSSSPLERSADLLVVPEGHENLEYYDDEVVATVTLDYQNIRVRKELQPVFNEFAGLWEDHLEESLGSRRFEVSVYYLS